MCPPLFIRVWPLFLLLASCAPVGPDYMPPAVDLPARFSSSQAVGSSQGPVEAQGRWWDLFNDPLLTRLVEQALAQNQDLRIAGSRIKAARARYRMASAEADPTLVAGAAYSTARRSDSTGSSGGSQDLFQVGFDADWEIDLFGGQRRTIEAASAGLEASEENRRDVRISLEAEVARNYFELRGSQRRLATAKDNLKAQKATLATVQGRFRLGLASQLEVAQARTQQSLLAAQIPALENTITGSEGQLALLLNMHPADLRPRLSQSVIIPEVPLSLPAGLPSDLLRRRPDIRRVERQLAAATAEIGIATADLFPRFSLAALVGLQSSSLSDLVSSGSRYWTLGPSLTLPLFNRAKLQAAVALSEAQREELLATYEKTVLNALIETEDNLVLLSRGQETRSNLAEAARTGRQAVSLNEGLYKAGLADLTDVLTSQRSQYQADDQLIVSEQQLALTVIALYKALGGGWQIAEKMADVPADSQVNPRNQDTPERP